jgi:hypothetical protein
MQTPQGGCAMKMQAGSVNAGTILIECVHTKAVLLDGEMAEWLKAAVC